jgi:recombination protein RecR
LEISSSRARAVVNVPGYLDQLIRELSRLPGVGPKSAARIAFHVLKMPLESVQSLSRALLDLKSHITSCSICGGISERDVCAVCADEGRDRGIICVVESGKDMITIERTGEFRGLYHVLQGVISPLDGIGPEDLSIKKLLERLSTGRVGEVIIATNPTVEGDATALYLARIIKPLGIRVMRIAHGLPVGADLEFTDAVTIAKSIAGRVEM